MVVKIKLLIITRRYVAYSEKIILNKIDFTAVCVARAAQIVLTSLFQQRESLTSIRVNRCRTRKKSSLQD